MTTLNPLLKLTAKELIECIEDDPPLSAEAAACVAMISAQADELERLRAQVAAADYERDEAQRNARMWAQEATRLSAQVAPAGYKLVPLEPTLEMMRAGGAVNRRMPPTSKAVHACDIYRAMLAASPAAPAQLATSTHPKDASKSGSEIDLSQAQQTHDIRCAACDTPAATIDGQFPSCACGSKMFNGTVPSLTVGEREAFEADEARRELGSLLMSMAIIRELTGTQQRHADDTVAAVRAALAQPAAQAEPAAVECWHGERKVTAYPGENVLRVWGIDMVNEMSEEPFSLKAVQDAMDWLYQPPQPAAQGVGLTNEQIDALLHDWANASCNYFRSADRGSETALPCRREDLRQLVRAALAQAPAAEPPTGRMLVPVEPTPEMLAAGRWYEYGEETSRMHEVDDDDVRAVWSQMLAAAPSYPRLTDEQLDALALDEEGLPNSHLEFARAIECAYGIGAAKEQP